MPIFHLFSKFNRRTEPIIETIRKIKDGDNQLKENFIKDYRFFIIKVVSKTSKKYIHIEDSDEFSIGMMAFNEAIDSYNEQSNSGFLSFAELVIKRRIIDYIRRNHKNSKVYPFTYFENSDVESNLFEDKYLKVDASSQFEKVEVEEEITLFTAKLNEFNISLADVIKNAPKHIDSKRLSIKIAKVLAENNELYEKLEKKKTIPMVDLLKLVNVNPKTIERNRKFIIAVCFILNSNLEVLKGYVGNVEKGGNVHE